ncbi:IS3 family transposase [Streptomyces sp. S.PB5]|uniref:IS3 family transposase n=1 Tax=Streptomyces sp. S.PB5 TaxID=3020844 RepID=UPI00339D6B73
MADEHLPVQLACRVLHVAKSGHYAWRDRPPSNRLVKHAWLTEAIVGIHTAPRGTYGTRRVHAELRLGLRIHASHGTVELLMQRAGLHGLPGNRRHRCHAPPSGARTPAARTDPAWFTTTSHNTPHSEVSAAPASHSAGTTTHRLTALKRQPEPRTKPRAASAGVIPSEGRPSAEVMRRSCTSV